MHYSVNTAHILIWMGYSPPRDFLLSGTPSELNLDWFHSDPKPTPEYIAQQDLHWRNSTTWAAQAAARKDREAKAALALPDSDDPIILRRKLNAALYLIQR
jgi:hypothetical protein